MDVETADQCARVPVPDSYSLLLGNHCPAPDYDVKIVESHFNF
jgi:hypothetical protein